MVDRVGNATGYGYDGSSRLPSVTDLNSIVKILPGHNTMHT